MPLWLPYIRRNKNSKVRFAESVSEACLSQPNKKNGCWNNCVTKLIPQNAYPGICDEKSRCYHANLGQLVLELVVALSNPEIGKHRVNLMY